MGVEELYATVRKNTGRFPIEELSEYMLPRRKLYKNTAAWARIDSLKISVWTKMLNNHKFKLRMSAIDGELKYEVQKMLVLGTVTCLSRRIRCSAIRNIKTNLFFNQLFSSLGRPCKQVEMSWSTALFRSRCLLFGRGNFSWLHSSYSEGTQICHKWWGVAGEGWWGYRILSCSLPYGTSMHFRAKSLLAPSLSARQT